MKHIPVSVIIPTAGRFERLKKTLQSIAQQSARPEEIIVIDGSSNETKAMLPMCPEDLVPLEMDVLWIAAASRGAGVQRNQGVTAATKNFILFMDDDIDLEPHCIEALWDRMSANPQLGGCNAMITNQKYHPPSNAMRLLLSLVGCPKEGSLAGRCCGPGLNFLADDNGPNTNEQSVDWLNTTCTLYRYEALPRPGVFLEFFQGYSLLEDAALSLHVGKTWELENITRARIFHDSQAASYKSQAGKRACMEWTNRWFIMTRLMGQTGIKWNFRLTIYQLTCLAITIRRPSAWRHIVPMLFGTLSAAYRIARFGKGWRGYGA